MADSSAASPRDWDFHFDASSPQPFVQYIAVDLRDGRFGVFVVHRDTREWWRLVAVFSTWERAKRYAGVETDCAPTDSDKDNRWKDKPQPEEAPAPAALPPEPPSRLAVPTAPVVVPSKPDDLADLPPALVRELSREAQEVAAASDPASPQICAREGCGKPIPPGRRRDGRYCSNQCRQTANNQKRVRSDTGTEIRYWTPAEDEVLRRRWPSEPHGPIAIDLRRSYGACEQRARKLGIKGPGQRSNFRRASEGGLGSTDLAQPEPGTEEIIEPAETAPEPQPEPAATKTAPAAPQSEIDHFIATKGVTVCPPAYVERVAGMSRLNPLPALVRDETTGKWRRADAG